jgi:hypothetical protein
MPHAWIENSAVRDVCHGDPALCYHPDIAKFYDTEVPPGTENGATLVDGEWVNPLPPVYVPQPDITPTPTTAELVSLIDSQTDAIYGAVLGNRGTEYELAEQEATAYKAAGYPTTAPTSVVSWATAKQWTNQQAADDIIATATAWRSAMAAIRSKRLLCKQLATSSVASVRADASVEWAEFVTAIKQQLGIAS